MMLQGCKCGDKNDIFGKYTTEIKGIEVKDSSVGNDAYSYLEMKSDETFRLYNEEKNIKISGLWSIKSCNKVENNLGENVPESILEFTFNDKTIQGTFRDNRIELTYPNDFYSGRYNSMWYVKLRDKETN